MIINLLTEPETIEVLLSNRRLRTLRLNTRRVLEELKQVNSIVYHFPLDLDKNSIEQISEHVSYLEDWAVRKPLTGDDLKQAVAYVTLFSALQERILLFYSEEENRELRDRFHEHGLHGMYRIPDNLPDVDCESSCIVCCDTPKELNVSSKCEHECVLCMSCAQRLDTCPLCRAESEVGCI
jgi:hypothetical protein